MIAAKRARIILSGQLMAMQSISNSLGNACHRLPTYQVLFSWDLARSVQEVTEEVMLRMARHVHRVTGQRNLCLAGGVALNCVGNGKILRKGPFDAIWIQPAAGDAGGALGALINM